MREARRKARRGLVVLTGANGVETTAVRLLVEVCTPGTVPVQLPDGLDFQDWLPDRDGGYLLRGTATRLLECPASLSRLIARLRGAHATLVIVVPSGQRLTEQAAITAAEYLVQCLPPDPRQVFTTRVEADAQDPRKLLSAVPDGFLSRFLPPWSSPQDAVDVAEALTLHESPDGLTRERTHDVRASPDHQADLEIAGLLQGVTDQDVMDVLIAAAVFRGQPLRVVLSEAERLASLSETPDSVRFDGAKALSAAARLAGIRLEAADHGESRIFFSRSGWADALLRCAWRDRRSGLLSRWLAGVADRALVEQAGWALGLSIPPRLRPLRPTEIRNCALRKEPLATQVAAAALRALLNESAHYDEAAKLLGGWTCGDSQNLHHLAALTCGFGSATAPLGPSLTLIRRLARRLEADYHRPTDDAAREAVLTHFRAGNRHRILNELVAWTSYGEAEGVYATMLFPSLVQTDLHWFHDRIGRGGEGAYTVMLIQRTLRLHGPGGKLRDVLATWQRLASRCPFDTDTFGDLLEAVGTDGHPQVQEFLHDLHHNS
ncbi:hypothetical protein [Actinocorallia sp. A-T 12471]|uniref:hypothetical protein n=1 Tax=Actinocorallia sp. A-T 12471 TaxID=3089813 RepID=UPI0029D3AD1E|nr:hypothetical protein [Actinocorallia sp. A-T 12471]MDX6742583.1 hypothetical protein [Actinocorallia sp. A-T 12471]